MFFPRLPKNFIHTLSQIFGDHLKGLFAKIVRPFTAFSGLLRPFTAFEPILKASLWPWWLLHVHKDTGLNPVQKYLYQLAQLVAPPTVIIAAWDRLSSGGIYFGKQIWLSFSETTLG